MPTFFRKLKKAKHAGLKQLKMQSGYVRESQHVADPLLSVPSHNCYMRHTTIASITVLAVVSVILIAIYPRTFGCCRIVDFDLSHGVMSYHDDVLFLRIHSTLVNTLLTPYCNATDAAPDWKRVSVERLWHPLFSESVEYIDPRYGSVSTDLGVLNVKWSMGSFTEQQKRSTAVTYLSTLRTNPVGASSYLAQLWNKEK